MLCLRSSLWAGKHLTWAVLPNLSANKQRPALSLYLRNTGGPMWMWSPSFQHVVCFQQQGWVCTLNGEPSWQLSCRNRHGTVQWESEHWMFHMGSPLWPSRAILPWLHLLPRYEARLLCQWFYQFLISASTLLHMLCEIQSSTSKGSLPLKGCMLPACKHCSDLIKFDFLISVVKPVLCLWANMAGISISMCIWPHINASQSDIWIFLPCTFSLFFLYRPSHFYALLILFTLIRS